MYGTRLNACIRLSVPFMLWSTQISHRVIHSQICSPRPQLLCTPPWCLLHHNVSSMTHVFCECPCPLFGTAIFASLLHVISCVSTSMKTCCTGCREHISVMRDPRPDLVCRTHEVGRGQTHPAIAAQHSPSERSAGEGSSSIQCLPETATVFPTSARIEA